MGNYFLDIKCVTIYIFFDNLKTHQTSKRIKKQINFRLEVRDCSLWISYINIHKFVIA